MDVDGAGNWSTIESDPGVFSELIEQFGVHGLEFEEIWDLDTLAREAPYGLIFLFKYTPSEPAGVVQPEAPGVFFAKQVINNACATQAIISILLNRNDVDPGPLLTEFKSFAMEFPSDMRGLALSNSDNIRTIHNSFAKSDPFVSDNAKDDDDDKEDAFHYVSYLPINGALYELDGLREGPINHGQCKEDDWVKTVRPVVEARMAQYAGSEIRFNMIALVKSKLEVCKQRVVQLKAEIAASGGPRQGMLQSELESVKEQMVFEEEKWTRWRNENMRRKHNWIGFAIEVLKQMATKGKLNEGITKGKDLAKKRDELVKAQNKTDAASKQ
ncbi:hypothetical protein SmJEL517_g02063 [Synchytrium microbalum]|uniref:Ubiquitin carboxyl-terminal hydrolase n=1 Tax=Synchytrium microbalum TaxID=1806994 RepID=A0A507C7G1_9FUNG|nr:uncharacterized protein SmJEL517_g02063 [Synchytrium microbalum]TPX35542.1 hypothetical protein SmJEL517_g02063 [Synchytrium microbalum]